MRILLTEVTGGLGRALARSLVAAGHDVVGIAERPHADLAGEVAFVTAPLEHPVLHELAADADVVVQLPPETPGVPRLADIVRVCDAAARAGARVVFPSLSLLAPGEWGQAEELVAGGWAPNLVVRLAPPLGRQADGLVCRTVATLLATSGASPVRVLHVDDLVRFLVTATATERTGSVDLGTSDITNLTSARRALGRVDPQPRLRGIGHWVELNPDLELTALQDDWGFECGWGAVDAVADTVRGLDGRRPGPAGARTVPSRFPMPVEPIPRSVGRGGAAHEPGEGEFDDHIDARFPVFVAAPLSQGRTEPLTPMSLDVHLAGVHTAGRALSHLLDLRGPVAHEWEQRLVSVFGHRLYLGASAFAAAEPRLPDRVVALTRGLRCAVDHRVELLPAGQVKAGSGRWASGALAAARLASAARSMGRHVLAFGDAADTEQLRAPALAALRDAQLDARIRLVRARIQQGWMLSALAVLLAHTSPAHVDGGQAPGVENPTRSGRIGAELASLAGVLRAHPYVQASVDAGEVGAARKAAPMFAKVFDRTLARIGHRGPGETELATVVFADRPDAVLTAASGAAHHFEHPDLGTAPAQDHRDLAYDATMRFTHQLRLAVRELARRRVAEETLAAVDDVFYLTTEEALFMPVDSQLRIKRRIAERERLQAIRLPAVIDGAWTPLPQPDSASRHDVLHGRGLTPGAVEGTIRVVRSAADAGLQAGDIAVVAGTDIDCAVLLGAPSAVLSDDSVTASDPATIAGDLDVPVVVGLTDAPTRLVTGMRVRVDGAAGTVTVLAEARESFATLTARARQ